MRRYVASVLAMAMLAGAACQPREATDARVVLRVANWGGAGDESEFHRLIRTLYTEFEAQNPGVEIQVEGIPGSQEYVSKILLSHVARSAPDIVTLDASSSAAFIEHGVLRDLTPYIESDSAFSLDDYYPNVVDIARRGKALYAIPGDFTPMVVYYNKDHFDAAGVPYPKPGWTRDEFLDVAKRLTRDGRHGFVFQSWMPGWIMWLWNAGGDVVTPGDTAGSWRSTLDTPENVRTIEWLRDLIVRHKVAPALSAMAAQGVDPFANGTAAMQVSGHWAIIGIQATKKVDVSRLGVAPLPNETGRPTTVMYESGFGIGRFCRNPDIAWKFVKFMTSYEVQRRYNATGIAICARKDVSSERAGDPLERQFLDIVPTARGPWGAQVIGYDLVEDIGQRMMDAILKNGVEPSAAVRQAHADIDRELAKR